jgi:hypothetical protein
MRSGYWPGAMNRTAMSILLINGSFQDFLQTVENVVPNVVVNRR